MWEVIELMGYTGSFYLGGSTLVATLLWLTRWDEPKKGWELLPAPASRLLPIGRRRIPSTTEGRRIYRPSQPPDGETSGRIWELFSSQAQRIQLKFALMPLMELVQSFLSGSRSRLSKEEFLKRWISNTRKFEQKLCFASRYRLRGRFFGNPSAYSGTSGPPEHNNVLGMEVWLSKLGPVAKSAAGHELIHLCQEAKCQAQQREWAGMTLLEALILELQAYAYFPLFPLSFLGLLSLPASICLSR